MKIAATLPDHGAIVEAILDGFVVAAMMIIQTGVVPPFPTQLPIRYRRETGESWLLPNQVAQVGEADCEDLCIWTAAGLRVTGQDPGAMCTLVNTGPRQIHCLVRMSDGQLYDPSLELRQRESAQKRAIKTMAVSGWGIGGQVVVTDHRKPGAQRQPTEGLPPPAAAPTGPARSSTWGPTSFAESDKTATRTNADGSITRWYQPGGALNQKPGSKYQDIVDQNRPGNIFVAEAAQRYAQSIGEKPTTKNLEDIGKAIRRVTSNATPLDPLAIDPLDPTSWPPGYDPYAGYSPFGPGYNPMYDPYSGGYAGGYGGMYGGDPYGNDAYVQQYLMQQTQPAYYDMPVTYEDIFGLDSEQWADNPDESELGDFIEVEGSVTP